MVARKHSPHAFPDELLPKPSTKGKSATEIAQANWDYRQTRMAMVLAQLFRTRGMVPEVAFEVIDELFGQKVGTEILHWRTPDGYGAYVIGDFGDLVDIFQENYSIDNEKPATGLDESVNRTNIMKEALMSMSEEQFEEFIRAIKGREETVWQRYGALIGVLATVLVIVVAVFSFNNTVKTTVQEEMAPIAEDVKLIKTSINGNPETGVQGINERLASIDGKFSLISGDTRSSAPPTTKDDPPTP